MLIKKEHHPHIAILVHAVLKTLPPTWQIFALDKEHKTVKLFRVKGT